MKKNQLDNNEMKTNKKMVLNLSNTKWTKQKEIINI